MKDPKQEHETQDDFEESLVRAVIEENPPEEQGLREEWKEQAGWHRKEDVYLRRRQNKNQPDLVQQRGDANENGSRKQNKIDGNHTKMHVLTPHHSWKVWVILAIMIGCIVFGHCFYSRRRGGKIRKKIEDLV
mmetsp:Transcript_27769/g.50139  ORF Transcript_27769/g.50139 Transcript_27769/m.50139 type:complete len:133 (+) Transcript_27769:53-451(+)